MRHRENFPDEEILGKSHDVALLARLSHYLKPYRKHLFISVLLVLVIAGVELLLPYLTKTAIDDYILVSARKVLLPPDEPFAKDLRAQYPNLLISTKESGTFFVKDKEIDRINHRHILELKRKGWMRDVRYYPMSIKDEPVTRLISSRRHLLSVGEKFVFIRYDDLKHLSFREIINLRQADISGVMWIGFLFIFLLVIQFTCSYAQVYSMEYIGQKVMHDIRLRLCAHVQRLSIHFFDGNPVGRLVTRITSDIQNLEEMFSSIIVDSVKDVFLLAGIMVVMLFLNWRLALLCFFLIPATIFTTIFFSIKARDSFREVRVLVARMNAYIQENFSGITVVKIFNRQNENSQRFQQINQDHYLANIRQIIVFALFMPTVELFSALAVALLIWQGGLLIAGNTISLGVLVAFLSYIQKMFQPIRFLAEKYNVMQSALASAERIFLLLDEDDIIPDSPEPVVLPSVRGTVEFRNVVFAYHHSGEPVLNNVSFRIDEGETVAIVGFTGAGKTTVLKLLVRFYDVREGQILLDNVDIRSLKNQFLRSHIGVVMQDSFLFADTVGYNIRLGNRHITDQDLSDVARMVNVDRIVKRLGNGFDEILSEEGSTLSTGERQLICFARVLALDPKILVLDEATSNIDPGTERLVQEALVKLTKRRTSLIIAHRLSTIQHADRILVLHKGAIKEAGTHSELMAKNGIYYRLYQLQN